MPIPLGRGRRRLWFRASLAGLTLLTGGHVGLAAAEQASHGELAVSGSKARPAAALPFSIQQRDSGWWLIAPEGRLFFSLGVCCVGPGAKRDELDPENPGYAAWQHYPDDRRWAEATLQRLKSWGFTTIGAWSEDRILRQSGEMTQALTPVLHMGSTAGAPWWDMWDPKVTRRMEAVARDQILAVRDDPRLLGYYTDNELGWWNATLFKMTLEQARTSGQRKRLIKLLRDSYHNDWRQLLLDFEPETVASWAELERGGVLYLRPGGNGIKVMRHFLGILAERYYRLVHQIIRKYDRRALILGDRYQSFYYPEVARACGPYVDAVSSNLNAHWDDGTFLRCYLDTLHRLTGKPVLVSEFYLAATANRSGNRNDHGVFPVATTQAQRAVALRNTLTMLARLPYVIGADWFQYFDEPAHGRDDGENFNFGLVDIHDQPYEEVTAAFRTLDLERLKTGPFMRRLNAFDGVPPAPSDPLGQFARTQALRDWDRERGFVPPASDLPLADLYVGWSPQGLYLGLYALDIVEEAYYRSRFVPKRDRALWVVRCNAEEAVSARVGAGREPLVSNPAIRVRNLSGVNLDVRNLAVMELPARCFGKDRLEVGDTLEINSTFSAHCQAYRTEWKTKLTLAR